MWQLMFQQSLMNTTPSMALNLKERGFSERDYLTEKIRGSADPTARCRKIGACLDDRRSSGNA
jgi:hypothetical protein